MPSDAPIEERDREARARAVDPRFNVALEASAGTGKTRVLVDRYVNLLQAGVHPANVLAITFTRKAAAEMRERIVATLRTEAARGAIQPALWRELRDRTADIAVSTIDAFCLSLLREFPLEAGLDPGFSLADETDVPRLVEEALDRAIRICRSLAATDEHVALVFAQLGERRSRRGLGALLTRRLVAPRALQAWLGPARSTLTVAAAVQRGAESLVAVLDAMPGGADAFVDSGPPEPGFLLLVRDLQRLQSALRAGERVVPSTLQAAWTRAREHFLTQAGTPRAKLAYPRAQFATEADWRRHRELVQAHAPALQRAYETFRNDLNTLVARGVWRMYRIAEDEYRRTLDAHAVLDFPDVQLRALDLLRRMDEFSQSRYRLESRYHHVLVDEFQDTSRPQWELVALLIESWGAGAGLAHTGPLPPSIFIVGDRKQSIYGFRGADASMLREASRHIGTLRPDGDVRRSISRSFRATPSLLAFVNDVCREIPAGDRAGAFTYTESDWFPVEQGHPAEGLGLVLADTVEACAGTIAREIAALIAGGALVRDRVTGLRRPVGPGDVAILFRTRESHREFEAALQHAHLPSYVYKGLGFFDADEVKDVLALLRYLADPASDLHAAALLRSRIVGLSDEGLRRLAPALAAALADARTGSPPLDPADGEAIVLARRWTARWLGLVDRMPPAEVLDRALHESAYAVELQGARFEQARENLKKLRALVRRLQNRGYATLARITAHLDQLAIGDEAAAVIDATDAVHLMTIHAAKGLEFPVVFVVNLQRGTGGRRDDIRVLEHPGDGRVEVSVGDFQSELDEEVRELEREETKRLLYVALTRARDRLYLGAVLEDGRLRAGYGSLGEVLPPTLAALMRHTGRDEPHLHWQAASGTVHRLQLPGLAQTEDVAMNATPSHRPVDVDRVPDLSSPRTTVTEAAALEPDGGDAGEKAALTDRLVGVLTHRLLQRFGLTSSASAEDVRRTAATWLAAEPRDRSDLERVVERAADVYAQVASRADLGILVGGGSVLFEVPFTMELGGQMVRGTMDCLVVGPDRVTVLEFKTGRPQAGHARQVELYARAAAALFPTLTVDTRIVYAQPEAR
jgi:ATP-dependent helicase/nuclease subunit A